MVESDLRALALINLGIAELWSGDLDEAERRLQAARGAAGDAGRDWLAFIALAHLAMVAGARDDFARSERQARDAIALAARARLGADVARGRRVPGAHDRRVPVGPAR